MLLLTESTGQNSAVVLISVAIIGAIGAIIASAIGGAFGSWFNRQQERQALAAAFAGEILCIVDSINWRTARKTIEEGKVPRGELSFPIFDANVGKIGFLPVDLAGKVALFYSDLAGVFIDFRTLDAVLIKQELTILNVNEIKQGLMQHLASIDERAKALVLELKKEASLTWRDYLES